MFPITSLYNSLEMADKNNNLQHYVGRVSKQLDGHLNVSYFRKADVPVGVRYETNKILL